MNTKHPNRGFTFEIQYQSGFLFLDIRNYQKH